MEGQLMQDLLPNGAEGSFVNGGKKHAKLTKNAKQKRKIKCKKTETKLSRIPRAKKMRKPVGSEFLGSCLRRRGEKTRGVFGIKGSGAK